MISKRRQGYLVLAFASTLLGLASRTDRFVLPEVFVHYGGDTFWALCAFWLVRALMPSARILSAALAALSFSFLVELSQFYKSPWIDGIRSTTIGALALGHGFKFSDLVCYSVGILVGVAVEIAMFDRRS